MYVKLNKVVRLVTIVAIQMQQCSVRVLFSYVNSTTEHYKK
jgi:hypothetical protein